MRDKSELMEKRDELRNRLAKETRWISAYDNKRLAEISGILAGIKAIDMVLEENLNAPDDDGPLAFFTP